MRITIDENGGTFDFQLEPETVEDSSLLVRLGLNVTTQSPHVFVYANDKGIRAYVSIGRRKQPNTMVKP